MSDKLEDGREKEKQQACDRTQGLQGRWSPRHEARANHRGCRTASPDNGLLNLHSKY